MADKKPHKREATSLGSTAQLEKVGASTEKRGIRFKLPFGKGAAKTKRASAPRHVPVRGIAITIGVICILLLVGAISLVVLSHTDAFTITSIDAEASEHVSSEDIAALAGVPEGTTLLNYDEAAIVANLKRNPWIADVSISRAFPDRLRVTVTERTVRAYVMMNSGSVTWCMGDDGVWVEPIKFEVGEGQSIAEAALAASIETGALLITDVPQTVNPMAGQPADDEVFQAINSYHEEFSDELWNQIVSINASSVEGISCILESGIEISLGSPTSITAKETVIQQLLSKYPNRLTYINVRVPASPSYRMVETESVEGGTGAIGDVATGTTPAPTETEPTETTEDTSEGE